MATLKPTRATRTKKERHPPHTAPPYTVCYSTPHRPSPTQPSKTPLGNEKTRWAAAAAVAAAAAAAMAYPPQQRALATPSRNPIPNIQTNKKYIYVVYCILCMCKCIIPGI